MTVMTVTSVATAATPLTHRCNSVPVDGISLRRQLAPATGSRLNTADVFDLTGGTNTLRVDGDSGDTADVASDWAMAAASGPRHRHDRWPELPKRWCGGFCLRFRV
jgi:hypothetical protein